MKNYNSNHPIHGYGLNAIIGNIETSLSNYATLVYTDTQDALMLSQSNSYTDTKFNSLGNWQRPVISKLSGMTPPTTNNGDRYLLSDNSIIEYSDGIPTITSPSDGMIVFTQDTDYIWLYNGSNWIRLSVQIDHNSTLGRQGGTTNEYYHLTGTQNNYVANFTSDPQTQINTKLNIASPSSTGNNHTHTMTTGVSVAMGYQEGTNFAGIGMNYGTGVGGYLGVNSSGDFAMRESNSSSVGTNSFFYYKSSTNNVAIFGSNPDSAYKLDVGGAVRANGNFNSTGNITSTGTVNGASATEMSYLSGVTSAIQTQLNSKAASSSLSNYLLTADATSTYLTISNASSTYYTISSATSKANLAGGGTSGAAQVFTGYHTLDGNTGFFCGATSNEIGYLSGTTSPIQTQIGTINTTLNGKATLNATCNWSANHTWSSNNLSGINDLTFSRMFASGIQYISRSSNAKKIVLHDSGTAKTYNDYSLGIGTNALEFNVSNAGNFTWHAGNSGDTAKTELMRLTNTGVLTTLGNIASSGTVTGTNVLSTNATDIATNTTNINNLKPGSGYYHKRIRISFTAGTPSYTWNEGFNTGSTVLSSNGLFLYPTSNYNSSNITFSIQVSGATPMINVCVPSVSQLEINLYDLTGSAVNWSGFTGTVYVQSMSS